MNYRWHLHPSQAARAAELAGPLEVSPLLAQCLLNRLGASEFSAEAASALLRPRLKQLGDPFRIPDMGAAVDRLWTAREQGEPVVIFGDYDVDGVTATAVLLEVFGRLGWVARSYLPHRLDEGYGLSAEAVERCLARYPSRLLLAVDCGSTSGAVIERLRARGIEVIVLDHHQVADPPPPAVALVNPQRGSQYRELSSAGLAFKLAHALVKRGRDLGQAEMQAYDLRPLLDLVALGTVADLVPLTGDNRILVRAGLGRLRTTGRPGLQALMRVAQVSQPVGVVEAGFQLGPRLNAAGRLENAEDALQLLLASDPVSAQQIALRLDARNRERQQIERKMVDEVIGHVRTQFNRETDLVIVQGNNPWHLGVIGIVAARVCREYHRPTVIFGGDGLEWRGSGRSIAGFDLALALGECRDLLVRFGGHAMAAGLSISPDNVDLFRRRLNDLARRALQPEQLQPRLELDAEVRLGELSAERVAEFEQLEPTGQGNPPVRLVARGVRHRHPPQRIGKSGQHLKLWVTDGDQTHEAIWWGAAHSGAPPESFDLAFEPRLDNFNGCRRVQLRLLDWRPATGASPKPEFYR